MGKKIFLLTFMLLAASLSASAQQGKDGKKDKPKKEDVYKSKEVMKEISTHLKNFQYAKAENSFYAALKKHKEAYSDHKLYNAAVEIERQLALEQNKNMYLQNNRADTAKFFKHIYNVYDFAIHLDSLESVPDEKGKVKYKYRHSNARKMLFFRNNLRSAGKFFYQKRLYPEAFQHIDMFIKSHDAQIVTSAADTAVANEDLVQVATLAVLSAYAAGQYNNAVKYIDTALNDTVANKFLLEVGAKSYAQLGDTLKGLNLLYSGVRNHPDYDYYFLTLVKFHNEHNQYQQSLNLASHMTRKFPKNRDYWYIKGKEELFLNLNDSALGSFSHAVLLKADDAESYSEMGKIYLRWAQEYYRSLSAAQFNAASRKKLKAFYADACKHFEAARRYNEADRSLWLTGLRECYFNLNRGKELRALERLK
jgi:hypothetical protein